jgi:hypothetical protein
MGKKAVDLSTKERIISLNLGGKHKVKEISGVTAQRLGAVENRETVGGVERAVTQSSFITEKWFEIHSWTKQRVLENLLEVAKEAWSGTSKKFQYIGDDMSTIILSTDSGFIESEFGVFITSANKDLQAIETLKQLAQSALQNDKIEFSNIIDIFTSNSLADMKNKLRQGEEKFQQRQAEMQQQQLEAQQQMAEQQAQLKREEMDREDRNKELDRQNKIDVATLTAYSFNADADVNNNQIPDALELEKFMADKEMKRQQIQVQRDKINLDKDKLNKEQQNKAKDREIKMKELEIKRKAAVNKPKSKK